MVEMELNLQVQGSKLWKRIQRSNIYSLALFMVVLYIDSGGAYGLFLD
jgi:hypothetical protein